MQSFMSLSGFGGFTSSVHFQRQQEPSQAQQRQQQQQQQHQHQHQHQHQQQHQQQQQQQQKNQKLKQKQPQEYSQHSKTSSPPQPVATAMDAMDVSASIQPVTPPQKRAHEAMLSASSRQDDTHTIPRMLMRHLTESEAIEVEISGRPVYYIPKHRYTYRGENNHGFDDSTGRYLTQTFDHFDFRYEIKSKLGMGAFGDCYKVLDHKTRQIVALKVIRNERRFKAQGLIEVDVLEKVLDQAHEKHAVAMVDHFTFRSHLCITFELHKQDLYSELSKREFVGFGMEEAGIFMQNILECLSLLKSHRIVHADLKPENVLISGSSAPAGEATVIDFGSACYESGKIHTYVQSRYYRAPEIVVGAPQGCAIDMWSLGCILFELLDGRPLFHAKNESDLLLYQMELLGVIPEVMLERSKRAKDFFAPQHGDKFAPKKSTDRRGRVCVPGSRDLGSLLTPQNDDPNLLDFLRRCLKLNPDDRMTPDEALQHPWIIETTRKHTQQTTHLQLDETKTADRVSSLLRSKDTGSTNSIDSGLESECFESPLKKCDNLIMG